MVVFRNGAARKFLILAENKATVIGYALKRVEVEKTTLVYGFTQ